MNKFNSVLLVLVFVILVIIFFLFVMVIESGNKGFLGIFFLWCKIWLVGILILELLLGKICW